MKNRFLQLALVLISLSFTEPGYSHHAAAVLFQMDKEVTVEGIVTKFSMGNPHARIYMDVENEEGVLEPWMAEGGSRTVLLRIGWTGDEVKPGDVVKIVGNPSRDGSNIFHWKTLILPDGSQKYGEDRDPRLIEDLRRRRRRY